MKIFGDVRSGNCLKVKYTADFLGLPYEWVDIDIMQGQSRTTEYLAINPQGQVPAIVLNDGRSLGQSNAIIRYLANNSSLLPNALFKQAKIDEWLFWEQYSHEPYVAVCRFHMHYLNKSKQSREAWRVERGDIALDALEAHLKHANWLAGEALSIADIALLAYTRVAHEGGFDLKPRPALCDWIARCEQALGLNDT